MIHAVFFDVDETLVDCAEIHGDANIAVFEYFGFDFAKIEGEVNRHNFFGMRVSDILAEMRTFFGATENDLPLETLIRKRQELFFQLLKKRGRVMPGAKKAVLRAKKDVGLVAIVSSGTRDYLNLIMEKFGLNEYIDFVVSGEDVVHGKPNPECYEKAFEMAHKKRAFLSKEDCLVVEDSMRGIESAKRAGMKVLYIPYKGNQEHMSLPVNCQLRSLEEFDLKLLRDI